VKRIKEPAYLGEVISSQFRIDPDQNQIAVLNPFDGGGFDATRATPEKEICFCGLPTDELNSIQAGLLKDGFFPQSIELSSIASLGALVDYLRFTENAKPTIVLEVGPDSTQSFIVSSRGVEASRPIGVGLEAMVPVVQKELGLKDEESARKLFFSNTFDFTGMGPSLCKRLLKELQSSMGFYEVQTGQSIGYLICTILPPKLAWLDAVIAGQIGVSVLRPDFGPWLAARKITLGTGLTMEQLDSRKLSLLGLIIRSVVPSHVVAA
jgi:Tfp pilus assembly PilM family ATPase